MFRRCWESHLDPSYLFEIRLLAEEEPSQPCHLPSIRLPTSYRFELEDSQSNFIMALTSLRPSTSQWAL